MKKIVVTKRKEAAVEPQQTEYSCEHCGRAFVRPQTLLKHLCEAKRRWDDRDRPANRIAYNAWLKFYAQIQPSRKRREYRDFAASTYYGGFIKFGIYCSETDAVNPMCYVDWLLKSRTPLDSWNSDRIYTQYLIEYLQREDAGDALQRTIDNMLKLSEEQNVELRDVFRYISTNKLCYYITCGKISPWLLYHSDTGRQFLGSLSPDHLNVIKDYIEPDAWNIRFRRYPESVKLADTIISGIPGL